MTEQGSGIQPCLFCIPLDVTFLQLSTPKVGAPKSSALTFESPVANPKYSSDYSVFITEYLGMGGYKPHNMFFSYPRGYAYST
jgi:hypothetical protein